MVKRQTWHPDGWMKDSEWLSWMSACRWFCDSFYSAAAVGIHAEDDLLQNLLLPRSADKHLLVTTIQATWSVHLMLLLSLNGRFSKIRLHLTNAFILFESKLKFRGQFTRTHVPSCLSIEFFSPDNKLNKGKSSPLQHSQLKCLYRMVIFNTTTKKN